MADSLHRALYSRFEKLPGVRLEQVGELLAVGIENDSASALVFLQGAQLAHYQRHGEHPVIWLSPHCDYRRGTPLRGGVPLCWPWFGDLASNPLAIRRQVPLHIAGAHGFARNRLWRLESVERPRGDLTRLVLSLNLEERQEDAWPVATALQLTLEIGQRLKLALEITNRSAQAFFFSGALHSYYAVSDIDRVSVQGLERMTYVDSVGERRYGRQRGLLHIDREVDRIYHGTWSPLKLIDHGWRRVLLISPEGSDSSVIWNPWVDKSRRLSHFADGAFREMLCIETANAGDDFVVLQPSQRHRLGFTLRCKPL